jgi:hypothetical protein
MGLFSKSVRAPYALTAIAAACLPACGWASEMGESLLASRFSQVLTADWYASGDTLVDTWETPEALAPPASVTPERHRSFSDLKPVRDIGRGLTVLASDTRAVFEAPLHMDRGDALWTLATVAVAGALYSQDQQLLDAFIRNRENGVYHAALEPGRALEKLGFIGSTAPYYAAGLTIGYVMRIDPLTEMTAEVLESHFIAGLVRNVLEGVAGRSRPRSGKGPRDFHFRGGDSFPSGHASVVFEVATVAAHHTHSTPLRVLYYAVATSISLQRVDSYSHWPSDVFVGAVIGTAVARAIVRRHAEAKRHAPTSTTAPPTSAPSSPPVSRPSIEE